MSPLTLFLARLVHTIDEALERSTVAFAIGVYVVAIGVIVGALVALDFVVRTAPSERGPRPPHPRQQAAPLPTDSTPGERGHRSPGA